MTKYIRIVARAAQGVAVFLILNAGAGSTAQGHDIGFVHSHVEGSFHPNGWIGVGIALVSVIAIILSRWLRRRQNTISAKNLV